MVDNVMQSLTSSGAVRNLGFDFFHCTSQKFAHMARLQIGYEILLKGGVWI
jgi:hypothetical protein